MDHDQHHGLGLIPDQPDIRDYRLRVERAVAVATDFSDFEAEMTPVKDQGSLGSCVAFGTVAVKEWQERKQRRRGQFDFSEAFLYELIRLPGGGAYPREAMKVLAELGVPRERFLPYREDINEATESQFTPTGRMRHNASFYKGGGYVRLSSIEQMEASLSVNGPFTIGLHWRHAWFRPTGAEHNGYPILQPTSSSSAGGHLVCAVGHDRARGLLKLRNSWSAEWGKGGYCYLSYEALNQNLLDSWATFDIIKAATNGLSVEIPTETEASVRV